MPDDLFGPSTMVATRREALRRMDGFAPAMGKRYASRRNYDLGPGQHRGVSQLSPYIRRRLVTEPEVIRAAVTQHGPDGAEKFIQEVLWRGYFKGWLERRPQVWTEYRTGLGRDLDALSRDRRLRRAVESAEAGNTGLDCLDAWVEELIETGYLHNHARMWFASIWIFTLDLPWRLGADFFLRHLLDGDPASNTLGWRWVAGLHTRGKAYKADTWNIAKFTQGRFEPRVSDLAQDIHPLDAMEPDGLPPLHPLRQITPPQPGRPTAILITEEDCNLEAFDLSSFEVRGAAMLQATHLRSPLETSALISAFDQEALTDAAERSGLDALPMRAGVPRDLAVWAQKLGAQQIWTPYVPEGPVRDWLNEARPHLTEAGISMVETRRDWDGAIWPLATAGFFKVKKKIPDILAQHGLL